MLLRLLMCGSFVDKENPHDFVSMNEDLVVAGLVQWMKRRGREKLEEEARRRLKFCIDAGELKAERLMKSGIDQRNDEGDRRGGGRREEEGSRGQGGGRREEGGGNSSSSSSSNG